MSKSADHLKIVEGELVAIKSHQAFAGCEGDLEMTPLATIAPRCPMAKHRRRITAMSAPAGRRSARAPGDKAHQLIHRRFEANIKEMSGKPLFQGISGKSLSPAPR